MRRARLCCLIFVLAAIVCRASAAGDSLSVADKCRFSLRKELTEVLSSVAINAAVTELLKDNISEWRPDGSSDNSFPSRHTSYAFTFASVLSHELYRVSPLWVSASHTLANAVAVQRVYASRHYPGDVLAGAAIGLASGELGYCISRWLFPSDRCRWHLSPACNTRALTTSTLAFVAFTSHSGRLSAGCGVESAASVGFPLSDRFGLGASVRMRSNPLYQYGQYVGALNGAAISADAYSCRSFNLWQAEAAVSLGIIHNFDRPCNASSAWAPLFNLYAGVCRTIAPGLSAGPRIGLDITNRPSALCALAAGLIIKAEF